MSKPIFIARVPWIKDTRMSEVVNEITRKLEEQLPDYHVLCFSKEDYKDFKFEAVNAEGMEPVDIEGLVRLLGDE